MPSCGSSDIININTDAVGGHDNKSILIYQEQCKLKLCNGDKQKQANNVYVSLFRGLSLGDYIYACATDCEDSHKQPCAKCSGLLSVGSHISEKGFILLSSAFKQAFPDQTYKPDIAILRFLQMPLASIRVGTPESGQAKWYLVEHVEGVDYIKFSHFAEQLFLKSPQPIGIGKGEVQELLKLATTDRDRALIRHSVYKTSGLTSSGARKQFGFDSIQERADHIEEHIKTVRSIRESIDKMSQIQDKAILTTMGLYESESESDSGSDSDVLADSHPPSTKIIPSHHTLYNILEEANFNWFAVADFLSHELPDANVLESHLGQFYSYVLELPLNSEHANVLTNSHDAYNASNPDPQLCRNVDCLNGNIVFETCGTWSIDSEDL